MVAMYRKVPAEIASKIPVTRKPWSARIHPIPIPIGFITAWIPIIIVDVF